MADLTIERPLATPPSEGLPESDVKVSQERDPFEPPASELLKVEVFENAELEAYVYENTDYYLNQWKNRSYRFNWAAFFLTGLWMLYRKMYWQFLALLGATVVLSLVEQILLPMSQTWISTLAVGLICGFFGNKWYHSHALRVIRKTRSKEPRADRRIELLHKRGKKTKPRAVVVIPAIAVIFIAFLIITS